MEARDILVNFEISLAVFIPNSPRDRAISYTNTTKPNQIRISQQVGTEKFWNKQLIAEFIFIQKSAYLAVNKTRVFSTVELSRSVKRKVILTMCHFSEFQKI